MTFDQHGHVLITPRELQRRAFYDPDGLINHMLTQHSDFPPSAKDHMMKLGNVNIYAVRHGTHRNKEEGRLPWIQTMRSTA